MPDFPAPFNSNQAFFQTTEPITYQLAANEDAARRRGTSQAGATGTSPPRPDPKQVFQTLTAAVTGLGDVLNKGQDVSGALATLANALASFTQSLTVAPPPPPPPTPPAQTPPAQNTGGGPLPPALVNPPPAPPFGIARPNPSAGPNQAFIELPVGTERAGLPPQPPMKPEPPIGLYPPEAGAPVFWTTP
jgi:hypothetical protein